MLNGAINYKEIAVIKTQMPINLASIFVKQKPQEIKVLI